MYLEHAVWLAANGLTETIEQIEQEILHIDPECVISYGLIDIHPKRLDDDIPYVVSPIRSRKTGQLAVPEARFWIQIASTVPLSAQHRGALEAKVPPLILVQYSGPRQHVFISGYQKVLQWPLDSDGA